MTNDKKKGEDAKENVTPKPDPETLHTSDPQEEMKGPVSSTMHQAGEAFDTDETKAEAEQKKEEHM